MNTNKTLDRLRAEIERLHKAHSGKYGCDEVGLNLEYLEDFIDSLQQEQSEVDLKKEIKEWTDLMVGASFPEQDGDFISEEDYRSVIRQTAIHFLGLNARKEDK